MLMVIGLFVSDVVSAAVLCDSDLKRDNALLNEGSPLSSFSSVSVKKNNAKNLSQVQDICTATSQQSSSNGDTLRQSSNSSLASDIVPKSLPTLPNEIIAHIFSFIDHLEVTDFMRYQTVSKHVRKIVLQRPIWVVLWKGKYRTQYHHIHRLVKLTKQIHFMDLSRTEISNEAFGALAQLSHLVSLNIAKTFIVWESAEHPINQLTALTHLRFTNENGWKRVARHIAALTTLRSLSVHGEAPLDDLLLFTFLESLEFKLCSGINTHFISHLRNLRELKFVRCPLVSPEFQWSHLRALTNVNSFHIIPPLIGDFDIPWPSPSSSSTSVMRNMEDYLWFHNHLESLSLKHCSLDARALSRILETSGDKLTQLSVCLKQFHDDCTLLSRLSQLEILDLSKPRRHHHFVLNSIALLNKKDPLEFVRHLTNLKSLDLSNTGLPLDIKYIAESLSLLTFLAIDSSPITDNKFTQITALTCLRELHLRKCDNLTAKSVQTLTTLRSLQHLAMSGKRIRTNAIASLVALASTLQRLDVALKKYFPTEDALGYILQLSKLQHLTAINCLNIDLAMSCLRKTDQYYSIWLEDTKLNRKKTWDECPEV